MIRATRVAFGTILGIIFGVLTIKLMHAPTGIPRFFSYFVLLSRALMGFGIGASGLNIGWFFNGALLGILYSLPSYPVFYTLSPFGAFWVVFTGLIYGIVIEIILTLILKI
uniref:ECF transporter S component n=1 Tax=candidate division WOR-3 bacterium TaxID=2052148 RepID=A0A7C3Z193_UNCW3